MYQGTHSDTLAVSVPAAAAAAAVAGCRLAPSPWSRRVCVCVMPTHRQVTVTRCDVIRSITDAGILARVLRPEPGPLFGPAVR